MRRVKFPLAQQPGTNLLQYPDDIALFSNTMIINGEVFADYTGDDAGIEDGVEPSLTGDPVISVEDYIDRYTDAAQSVIALESTNVLKRIKFWLSTHRKISLEAGEEGALIAQHMLSQGHITQGEHDSIVAY